MSIICGRRRCLSRSFVCDFVVVYFVYSEMENKDCLTSRNDGDDGFFVKLVNV